MLKEKLSLEPDYYKGWVILAKSYLIIDDISASVTAYENALKILWKHYDNTMRMHANIVGLLENTVKILWQCYGNTWKYYGNTKEVLREYYWITKQLVVFSHPLGKP